MMNKTSLDRVDIPVTIITSKKFLINVKDKVENNIKNPIEYFLGMYKSGVICWKDSDPTENIGFHSSDNAAHNEERKNDPDAKGENDNKFKSNNNTIKTKNTYTESRKF